MTTEPEPVDTTDESIAAALLVLDHARTEVQYLHPDDRVFLYDHATRNGRAVGDSGYRIHTIVRAERTSDRMPEFEVVTDRASFRCSPRYGVYLVGHRREPSIEKD